MNNPTVKVTTTVEVVIHDKVFTLNGEEAEILFRALGDALGKNTPKVLNYPPGVRGDWISERPSFSKGDISCAYGVIAEEKFKV